jgi:hypothetical protein
MKTERNIGIGWIPLALIIVAAAVGGQSIRTAFAHEPSECVCPPCPECVAAPPPSAEQVQAVQRAYDAILAVEAVEDLPLGTLPPATTPPVTDSPPVGPAAP